MPRSRHVFRLAAPLAAVVSALALGAAAPAVAQDNSNGLPIHERSGWYGTLGGAWTVPRDYDGSGNPGELDELKTFNGYSFFGSGGYGFGNGFRTELELGYGNNENDLIRRNDIDQPVGGSIDQYSAMGAVYYDIDTGYRLTPYLGGGGGLMHQRNSRPAASVNGASLPAGGSSTDLTAFGEVGLSYPLNRSLDLLSAYRYQWVDDGHHGLDDGGIHNLKFGLRYWFN